MKNLIILIVLLGSLASFGQEKSQEHDSKLIGKWEFNKVEITYRSDRDREMWNKPFYLIFSEDGSMLVVMDDALRVDLWHTENIDELKLEDGEGMSYSLVNDDILILGVENTLISMNKVKCNWNKERVLIDSALAAYEIRKANRREIYDGEEVEMEEYYEGYEDDEPEDGNEVYEIFDVSQVAKFPGGEDSLKSFIAKNLVYPTMAKENAIQGSVNLMFVVNEKGGIEDVVLLGGKKGFGLDEEAIRLVKLTSGQWQPAKQRDKPVKMRFRIPINFEL